VFSPPIDSVRRLAQPLKTWRRLRRACPEPGHPVDRRLVARYLFHVKQAAEKARAPSLRGAIRDEAIHFVAV
jgi:hypothetical protein